MVQLQVLSRVIATHDISIIVDNNLTKDYFLEYEGEYDFILEHYNNYKNVPDAETFISAFPEFDILQVTESDRYLVDTIREEYLYSKSVPVIKKAAELLKGDANAASQYLQSELSNLTPNYTTPYVDIIHSDSRLNVFEDKNKNKSNWFIPTGFEELDDIVCGWQRGEEYVVVFARTGQGKSWMVVKFTQHAWQLGMNVGYISPEMSADKIGYRFDTINGNLSNRALTRGDTSEISVEEYSNYIEKLKSNEAKFLVCTPRDFNNKITVSKLKTFIFANKLDILAIDGITYLSDERAKSSDNTTTKLTHISEDLMQLSCELKIPIIVVVQSNRGGVDKDTPDLEDIRDSDGIAHNATKVISLKQKGEGGLILHIKKNRDGKNDCKLTYHWDIDTGVFNYTESLDENEDDEPMPKQKRERKVDEENTKPKGKIAF